MHRGLAVGPRLHVEPDAGPVLLRFVEGAGGGAPRALHGDEDPPPDQLVERLLLQREAEARGGAKRRRLGAGVLAAGVGEADAELPSGDERIRALREAREAAMQALHRADQAAELLRRTTWGEEKVAFLKLLPSMQEPPAPGHRVAAARALEPAAAARAAAFRAAGHVLAGPPPGGAVELEATLRYLRPRWLVHFVRGAYAVELWKEEQGGKAEPGEDEKWPAGKFLAYVGHHPQHGPGIRFPPELSGAVEGRRRLAVRISPLGGRPAADGCAARDGGAEPWEAAATRGEAVHAVLLDAQEALVDLCAFRRFRRDLLEGDAVRRHAYRWHLSRASASEVSLTVPVGACAELVSVSVGYGPRRRPAGSARPSAGSAAALWEWLSELATLRLRELFLEGAGGEEGPVAACSLFGALARWAEPQLEAVARRRCAEG